MIGFQKPGERADRRVRQVLRQVAEPILGKRPLGPNALREDPELDNIDTLVVGDGANDCR